MTNNVISFVLHHPPEHAPRVEVTKLSAGTRIVVVSATTAHPIVADISLDLGLDTEGG